MSRAKQIAGILAELAGIAAIGLMPWLLMAVF